MPMKVLRCPLNSGWVQTLAGSSHHCIQGVGLEVYVGVRGYALGVVASYGGWSALRTQEAADLQRDSGIHLHFFCLQMKYLNAT